MNAIERQLLLVFIDNSLIMQILLFYFGTLSGKVGETEHASDGHRLGNKSAVDHLLLQRYVLLSELN